MRAVLLLALLAQIHPLRVDALDLNGEIRGFVLDPLGRPVENVTVKLASNENSTKRFGSSSSTGAYQFADVPGGVYTAKMAATGFYTVEVRDIRVRGGWVTVLPPVRLDIGLLADCDLTRRPDFYRPLAGALNAGGIGGIVSGAGGKAIAGATVTLFRHGRGRIASLVTDTEGSFSFAAVEVEREGYWIVISCEGYFSEELLIPQIWSGLESVYVPIGMEACRPGFCDPNLKTIRVLPRCAE